MLEYVDAVYRCSTMFDYVRLSSSSNIFEYYFDFDDDCLSSTIFEYHFNDD
jgi:hypothetical protein